MPTIAERGVSAREKSHCAEAQAGPSPPGHRPYESSLCPQYPTYGTPASSATTFLANTKSATAIPDIYQPRQLSFRPLEASRICDEKIIRHDHSIARHYESQSTFKPHVRNAIQHRDLGSLSLIANLTRIRFGFWHDDPACLIGFKFQFLGSESRWTRFEKAEISIRFSSTIAPTVEVGQESSSSLVGVGADPEVVDFGPKHLSSSGTTEKREWHVSAQLAASLPVAPTVVTPSASAGFSRSYDRHYASSIEAAAFPSHGHTSADTVRFWVREDAKQKDGIPLDFDCAAIVAYAAPANFQATVEIKAGPMFDMFAQPWGDSEPITFKQGIELGQPLGFGDNGMMDFANLKEQEWSTLVGTEAVIAAAGPAPSRETPAMSGLRYLLHN